MISTGSLAAFSASLASGASLPGLSSVRPAVPLVVSGTQARAGAVQNAPAAGGTLKLPAIQPDRPLPRGSLLNLSV